jgi:hypothetical protein
MAMISTPFASFRDMFRLNEINGLQTGWQTFGLSQSRLFW